MQPGELVEVRAVAAADHAGDRDAGLQAALEHEALARMIAGMFDVNGPLWRRLVFYAAPLALAAVVSVLLLGLWNMMRGDSPNASQTLMRWRVVLQFVAVCLVMTALFLSAGS